MSKIETVDNFDDETLNELFAELDEQNLLIEEEEQKKKAKTETVSADDIQLDEELLEDEELLAAELEASIEGAAQVTPEEIQEQINQQQREAQLDAEQELDLQEAFEPKVPEATPHEIVNDSVSVEDMLKEVEAEQTPMPQPEERPILPPVEESVDTVCEELPDDVELQSKDIPNFEPKQVDKQVKSEKEIERFVSLKYAPDVEAFNRDIQFTDATLDVAMRTQASLAAYQNERAARVVAQAAKVKLKFESLEALLYEAYRKHFLANGEKVTEKAVENAVRKDSRWIKAKELYIEAEMYADIHKGFVYALRDRNDMLIQRGAYSRQERQGQLRMNEYQEQHIQTFSQGREAAQHAMKKNRNLS